jgi:hypothetical protein
MFVIAMRMRDAGMRRSRKTAKNRIDIQKNRNTSVFQNDGYLVRFKEDLVDRDGRDPQDRP